MKILSIDLAIDYGYNGCSGFVRENCDTEQPDPDADHSTRQEDHDGDVRAGHRDPAASVLRQHGRRAGAGAGRVSSNPPGPHAGNLDNKALVAGTTLFIPVFAPGALFEVGDGHAAQGDGEVDQTAIETSLRGRLQLTVRKGMKLAWPRAETATDYISMGTDEDLTKATKVAIQEMIDFLVAEKKMDKMAAYQLTSIAGNVAMTQLVDGKVGVHVKMPKEIFK